MFYVSYVSYDQAGFNILCNWSQGVSCQRSVPHGQFHLVKFKSSCRLCRRGLDGSGLSLRLTTGSDGASRKCGRRAAQAQRLAWACRRLTRVSHRRRVPASGPAEPRRPNLSLARVTAGPPSESESLSHHHGVP